MWNEFCELSIYRKNSQLICEKLWERVIQYSNITLGINNSLIRSSTKISQIEYQNIVQKYIILSIKVYFRSSSKIY